MAILPWVNLPQNRTPDQLGSIGDTLVDAARRKQQQEQQAADLLLRQRTADREDKLTSAQLGNYASEAEARKSEAEMRKAQQKRIDEEEKRKQGLDVATAIPTIRAMLTPGSPTYDPQSAMSLARAHGIDLAATQPAAPVQPQIGPTSVEEGPRETPEIAQQAGLERAVRNVPGDASPQAGAAEDQRQIQAAEQERQRFAQANDPEAVQRNKLLGQQYADQVSKFRTAQPTYSGTSPIGPVNIDPNAALESQRFALEENRRKMAPLMNIPGMEKYAPGIQAAIASGAKPEQVNALVSKAIEDSRKDQEKADYSLTADDQRRHNLAMERAAMANAGARRDGQDEGITPEQAADLGRLAQSGATQDQLLTHAAKIGVRKPLHAVTTINRDPEKQAALEVRDEVGNVLGTAPNSRAATQTAGQLASASAYKDAINAYADHISAHDRILNPYSDEARERERLHADVVARGRKAMELGVSNANLQLEHQAIGGAGVGFDTSPMTSPDSLRKLAEEVDRVSKARVTTLLRPQQQPTVGERLTGAAKKQTAGNPLTRAAGAEAPADRKARLLRELSGEQ